MVNKLRKKTSPAIYMYQEFVCATVSRICVCCSFFSVDTNVYIDWSMFALHKFKMSSGKQFYWHLPTWDVAKPWRTLWCVTMENVQRVPCFLQGSNSQHLPCQWSFFFRFFLFVKQTNWNGITDENLNSNLHCLQFVVCVFVISLISILISFGYPDNASWSCGL